MIRVLIVDDEALQRQLVRAVVDWDKLGMEIAGEAEDGRQAVQMAEALRPDILIMDINIPHFSGLEAALRIRAFLPEVQVLILSAYGEFGYAQEALRMGAIRFVLKPLDPEELIRALEAAREIIGAIGARRSEIEALRSEQREMEAERFLLARLSQANDGADDRALFERHGVHLFAYASVALLRGLKTWDDVRDLVAELFPGAQLIDCDGDLCALVGANEQEALALRLHALLEELEGFQGIAGGVSDIHAVPEGLGVAWMEAQAALRKAAGGIRRYEAQSLAEMLSMVAYSPERLQNCLRAQDWPAVYALAGESFRKLGEAGAGGHMVFYVAMSILIGFYGYAMERGVDLSGRLGEQKMRIERLNGDAAAAREAVLALLREGIDRLNTQGVPSTRRKVEEARRYIHEHYASPDIGLNAVSESIGVNPSYLSNVFKAECRCSLTNYLMRVRMERAKEILTGEPDATVADAAERVGYSDAYYFSKSFKKHFGIPPSRLLEERP